MAGLYIERKKDLHMMRWLTAFAFVCTLFAAGWFTYQWFTKGERPPLVPLPASAMADTSLDETTVTDEDKEKHLVERSYPRFISIPSLNIIKARVNAAGLTPQQTLETPKNINDAAWYKESAVPGQGYGSVLINGHSSGVSRDAIFTGLAKLTNGDKIIIERGDGKEFTYSVVESLVQPVQQANTTGIKLLMTPQDTTKEGLGIITCAGNWIPRDKIYDKRLLVRAIAE